MKDAQGQDGGGQIPMQIGAAEEHDLRKQQPGNVRGGYHQRDGRQQQRQRRSLKQLYSEAALSAPRFQHPRQPVPLQDQMDGEAQEKGDAQPFVHRVPGEDVKHLQEQEQCHQAIHDDPRSFSDNLVTCVHLSPC